MARETATTTVLKVEEKMARIVMKMMARVAMLKTVVMMALKKVLMAVEVVLMLRMLMVTVMKPSLCHRHLVR